MINTITIPNIEEFIQQIINGNLVLTRIVPFIDEATLLFQKNLLGSTILECKINNVNNDIKKYKKLLIYVYSITNIEIILQNTQLNISREQLYEKGFEYYNQLGISIQGADAKRTLNEIIRFIKINQYSMELKIRLKNEEVVRFIV
jgi:uncharacterized protein YacL (UPF0231 family)